MRNNVLLKTFLLVVVLAAVLAVMFVTVRGSFGTASVVPQRQTLFEQFVVAGGPIVWFILLPMSFIMVYLAAEHSFTIRRKKLLPEGISRTIIEIMQRSGLVQLKSQVADKSDFVSTAVNKALSRVSGDYNLIQEAMAESLQEQSSGLLRRIEWLNLIGNVSPMVGLFGTVVGMIQLFNAIVTAGGQPQPAQLAGGISVALVTTFWGLLIAIPALAIHHLFRSKIEALLGEAVGEAENILQKMKRIPKGQTQAEQAAQRPPIRELPVKPAPTSQKSSLV